MKKIRLLLADDHDIVLEGIRKVLDRPEFEVVGTAADGRKLISAAKTCHPDIIITDVTMPSLNGIDAARRVRKLQPKVGIVFFTMHSDSSYAAEAMGLGNCAYVLKSSSPEELPVAIHEVLRGNIYVSPRIAAPVLENLGKKKPTKSAVELTIREREILQLIAEGRTFKEIAALLEISPRTVEFHRNRIADKTGQKTMADLTRYAMRIGVVTQQ